MRDMNDQCLVDSKPSTATDSLLLFLALLLGIFLSFTIVGILPVLILVFGLFLSVKTGKADFARKTTKFIQMLVLAVAFFCFVGTIYTHVQLEKVDVPADPSLDSRFAEPETIDFEAMAENLDAISKKQAEEAAAWTAYNNAMSSRARINETRNALLMFGISLTFLAMLLEFILLRPFIRQLPTWRESRLLKRSGSRGSVLIKPRPVASISVADELAKWTALRNDGVVTEEEYSKAREELLRQK